mmetsp:Transcript_15982/g.34781  ORF Transcript_15982/g.34781 Transcript_15982/m.34781 type:complete len:578 (-) Transcript_15982:141-1874(-)
MRDALPSAHAVDRLPQQLLLLQSKLHRQQLLGVDPAALRPRQRPDQILVLLDRRRLALQLHLHRRPDGRPRRPLVLGGDLRREVPYRLAGVVPLGVRGDERPEGLDDRGIDARGAREHHPADVVGRLGVGRGRARVATAGGLPEEPGPVELLQPARPDLPAAGRFQRADVPLANGRQDVHVVGVVLLDESVVLQELVVVPRPVLDEHLRPPGHARLQRGQAEPVGEVLERHVAGGPNSRVIGHVDQRADDVLLHLEQLGQHEVLEYRSANHQRRAVGRLLHRAHPQSEVRRHARRRGGVGDRIERGAGVGPGEGAAARRLAPPHEVVVGYLGSEGRGGRGERLVLILPRSLLQRHRLRRGTVLQFVQRGLRPVDGRVVRAGQRVCPRPHRYSPRSVVHGVDFIVVVELDGQGRPPGGVAVRLGIGREELPFHRRIVIRGRFDRQGELGRHLDDHVVGAEGLGGIQTQAGALVAGGYLDARILDIVFPRPFAESRRALQPGRRRRRAAVGGCGRPRGRRQGRRARAGRGERRSSASDAAGTSRRRQRSRGVRPAGRRSDGSEGGVAVQQRARAGARGG